jgi:hypothetical protein
MNISICIYGQPRLYRRGHSIIEDFIRHNSEHHFDIFFHTWFDEDKVGEYYQCAPWRNIPKEDLLIEECTIEKLRELYQPKKYSYDTPKLFELNDEIKKSKMFSDSPDTYRNNANNTLSSIYSKYMVSQLMQEYVRETSKKYDYAISIRFDFLNKLDFKIEEMIMDKINVMNVQPRLYIPDNFIATNYDLFIKYSNTYPNLNNILRNVNYADYLNHINCGYGFVTETLVTANLLFYFDRLDNIIHFHNKIPNFV